MPRKAKVVYAEQVYNLPQYGPEARVTVRYDPNRPPPFYQPASGVVIVGQYAAAGSPLPFDVPPAADRADLEAVRARLERSQEPVKPRVLTPADLNPPNFDTASFEASLGVRIAAPNPDEGSDA